MQIEMPYSLIVWENVSSLPFPEEVNQITQSIQWEEYEWHVSGLPVAFAKYSVSDGKTLYFSEFPNGTMRIEKSAFTGDVQMSGFFVDEENPNGLNFLILFVVTFLKGEVIDVVLSRVDKQSTSDYRQAVKDFNENMRKAIKTSSSWWYKWIYRPWYHCVRWTGVAIIWSIELIRRLVIYIVSHLTPI